MTLRWIDGRAITEDAIATIAWGGLLGNRYIDITLGRAGSVSHCRRVARFRPGPPSK